MCPYVLRLESAQQACFYKFSELDTAGKTLRRNQDTILIFHILVEIMAFDIIGGMF